jgi:hypothetical protein
VHGAGALRLSNLGFAAVKLAAERAGHHIVLL